MAALLAGMLFLTTSIPVWIAWRANRHTSLLTAVNWGLSGWTVWGMLILALADPAGKHSEILRYLALCVTGCCGVAVLGARRPGVHAWNLVVIGLLAVLLLPVAEGAFTGKGLNLDSFRCAFLAATLAVGILNYLPTRHAAAVALMLIGCIYEVYRLLQPADSFAVSDLVFSLLWLLLAPWTALFAMRGQASAPSEFDKIWLGFRDRFGLVWGQRLREQFNRSAAHAGWQVILRWQGLRLQPGASLPDLETQTEMVSTLQALTQRFRTDSAATRD